MKETSARLLRLLTLLQTRREWSGADLAERLGVTTRTIRRDVDKLRALDYPVHATSGTAGGYQLGPGAELPPLLLDDDEAVAVALGLRTAASSGVAGVGETALRALVKLEQVLPSRLRYRVNGMRVATIDTPGNDVSLEVLTAVAAACRDRQRLRFDYTVAPQAALRNTAAYGAEERPREVEPHQLVCWGKRWYLVAWDVRRDDWRTFRVDRMRPKVPLGARFRPRDIPGGDAAAFVAAKIARMWPFQATVRLPLPAEHEKVRELATYGTVERIDEGNCRLTIGADTPQSLAFLLSFLEIDFVVESSVELARALHDVAERFQRAAAHVCTAPDAT
ncbi:YafY family protein [Actinophytocola sp.]|uniref:helix-turn-helix transcriptional regulator n=1 Tax=Actinophytocola sp. TaxID=1872138 RepID=UPI002ED5CE18